MWFEIFISSRFAPPLPISVCAQHKMNLNQTSTVFLFFLKIYFRKRQKIQYEPARQRETSASHIRVWVCSVPTKAKSIFPLQAKPTQSYAYKSIRRVTSRRQPYIFSPGRFAICSISNHIYIGLCAFVSLSILQSVHNIWFRYNNCCTVPHAHIDSLFTCSQWISIDWRTEDRKFASGIVISIHAKLVRNMNAWWMCASVLFLLNKTNVDTHSERQQ